LARGVGPPDADREGATGPAQTDGVIEIGPSTGRAEVIRIARGSERVRLSEGTLARIRVAHRVMTGVAASRAVYGRSTGVGANVLIRPAGNQGDRDRDLLRSHAVTAGPPVPRAAVRAMLAVRLRQLADGRSGISPAAAESLCGLLDRAELPAIGSWHGVGTGDLGALATVGLALPPGALQPGDALPLLSSSALTIGRGVLVHSAANSWWQSAVQVAALTAAVLDAAAEAWDPDAVGGSPGNREAAVVLQAARAVSGPGKAPGPAPQDGYGLRTAPQQLGHLRAALDRLADELGRAIADGPENPAVLVERGVVVHHGAFQLLALTAAIDGVGAALARAADGSRQRLGLLMQPRGGGPAFQAAAPGRSGLLALEYVAASALAEIRAGAVPAGLQTVSLGLGVESDACHAPQAVSQLERSVPAASTVIGAELLAAVRSAHRGGRAVDDRFAAVAAVADDTPADLTGLLEQARRLVAEDHTAEWPAGTALRDNSAGE